VEDKISGATFTHTTTCRLALHAPPSTWTVATTTCPNSLLSIHILFVVAVAPLPGDSILPFRRLVPSCGAWLEQDRTTVSQSTLQGRRRIAAQGALTGHTPLPLLAEYTPRSAQ